MRAQRMYLNNTRECRDRRARRRAALAVGLGLVLFAAPVGATIVAPGFIARDIATPGPAAGGIAAVGGQLFVGVGSFGGAAQSVVRIDANGVATTLADGFNSVAGVRYDTAGDRLLVGDNALEAAGSETGDTLYAIPNPFAASASPLRARDLELLPAGSIPGLADLTLDPNDASGGTLLVSEATGNFLASEGRVLSVDTASGSITELATGLDFAAGIAATANDLFVGEVNLADFSGRISVLSLPAAGGSLSLLVDGLAGQGGLVVASDGTLLATASAFGGDSLVLRIDPVTGDVIETLASGFDFATALDEENGVLYVIEGGFGAGNRVIALTPVPEPSALALSLAGGLVLWTVRRRGMRS